MKLLDKNGRPWFDRPRRAFAVPGPEMMERLNFQSVFRNAEESLWVCVSKLFQRVLWFGAGELRVQLSSCRRTRNLRFIVFLSFSQSRKAHKSRLLVVEGVQFSISNIDIAGLLIEIAFSCCLAVAFLHAYLIRNVFMDIPALNDNLV